MFDLMTLLGPLPDVPKEPQPEMVPSWTPADLNQDGIISASDIPFEPGTLAAKKAFLNIKAIAHSPESIAKAKALGYEDARGWYNNGPLIPNSAGPNEQDFTILKDKLVWYYGYAPETIAKILGKTAYLPTGS